MFHTTDDHSNIQNQAGMGIPRVMSRLRGPAVLAVAELLLVAFAGCHHGAIRASSLSPEYMAPVVRSTERLDLSQLARANAGNAVVQSGDLLAVSITTGLDREESVRRLLRVADDGSLNIPLVGQVRVGGLEVVMAEALVREAGIHRGVYRNPQVSIQIEDRRTNRVTVLGAVESPGAYEIPASHSDLLAALVAAGGPRDDAATEVEIRHPPAVGASTAPTNGLPGYPVHQASHEGTLGANEGLRFVRVDLSSADSVAAEDLRVYDGTVVMVQQRAPQTIYVMGLVKKADQYELPPDEDTRLLDAIAMAGGRTLQIADRVRITRKLPHLEQSISIDASIKEAERDGSANIRLAAGDMVHVKETPATFTIEMLRSFIRFGFSSAIPGF